MFIRAIIVSVTIEFEMRVILSEEAYTSDLSDRESNNYKALAYALVTWVSDTRSGVLFLPCSRLFKCFVLGNNPV